MQRRYRVFTGKRRRRGLFGFRSLPAQTKPIDFRIGIMYSNWNTGG